MCCVIGACREGIAQLNLVVSALALILFSPCLLTTRYPSPGLPRNRSTERKGCITSQLVALPKRTTQSRIGFPTLDGGICPIGFLYIAFPHKSQPLLSIENSFPSLALGVISSSQLPWAGPSPILVKDTNYITRARNWLWYWIFESNK